MNNTNFQHACLHIAIRHENVKPNKQDIQNLLPQLMKGEGTPMATSGQNMPYTTGHSRYFSIEYSDLNVVPKVFSDVWKNTLNIPEYTTVDLITSRQSAYVDRNLIRGGMLPNDTWQETHPLDDFLIDLLDAK